MSRVDLAQQARLSDAEAGLNRTVISGRIVECDMLRYTPGGLPIIRFRIAHVSTQVEAGSAREVVCTVNAVAIGEVAAQLPVVEDGVEVAVRGFLCRAGLNDDRLVLHADAFRVVPGAAVDSSALASPSPDKV